MRDGQTKQDGSGAGLSTSLSKALLADLAENVMEQAAVQMTQAENEQAAGEREASRTSLAAARALRFMARAARKTANAQNEARESRAGRNA